MTSVGAVQQLIVEICAEIPPGGDLCWREIHARILKRIADMPAEKRALIEHELNLMTSGGEPVPAADKMA